MLEQRTERLGAILPTALRSLEIKNFGGFEDLILELDPECTVVCGLNGAGKSTVLGAIGYLLKGLLQGDGPTEGSVRRERVPGSRESLFRSVLPARIQGDFVIGGEDRRATVDILSETDFHTMPLFYRSKGSMELAQDWQLLSIRPLHAAFLVGRSAADRSQEASVSQAISRKPDVKDGYKTWWDAKSSISSFAGWLAAQHMIEQEDRTTVERSPSTFRSADTQEPDAESALSMAKSAVGRLIPGCSDIRYSFREREIVLTYDTGEEKLANLLSDGERSMLALCGGLIVRAHQLNGQVPGFRISQCPGIVLIDEIEMHLHPGWQQRIVPQLRASFPRVQFIVTTHSPAVLSTVPSQSIRILSRNGSAGSVENVTFSEGAEVQLLWDRVFDVATRAPETLLAQAIKKYDRMLEDGTWESNDGRKTFEKIRLLSHDEDPVIGRYLGAQRLASMRKK